MLNVRMLKAWPNWVIIPAMLVFWIVTAALLAELLGAKPFSQES